MGALFTTRALLGAPYDADALAWRRAVVAQGGPVSAAQLARIARLVRALKARGVWDRLDRLWIFAAENATQALTDLRTRSLATLSPTPPGFTALRGFIGNGMSAYVDLGVAASALTKFTQNAGHLSLYLRDGDGVTNAFIGARDNGSGFSSEVVWGSSTTMNFLIQTAGAPTSFGQSAQNGFHIAERSSATTGIVSNNGVDEGSQTIATSSSRATSNLAVLARNTSGTYSVFSGSRIGALTVGGALGGAGRAALYQAMGGCLTSVGA